MVGWDNRGQSAHSRTLLGSRPLTQRPFRRRAAAKAGTAVHNSSTPGTSRAEMCTWMPGFRAKQAPDRRLVPTAPGEDRKYSKEKETFRRSTGSAGRRTEGEKPLFCTQQGWLGRHLSGKQPVKDGGVCRVIGPSPGKAGTVIPPPYP